MFFISHIYQKNTHSNKHNLAHYRQCTTGIFLIILDFKWARFLCCVNVWVRDILPTSCTRAILTILKIKEVLGLLKNWRPVCLLITDSKMLLLCLSNRLNRVSSDQIRVNNRLFVCFLCVFFFYLRLNRFAKIQKLDFWSTF